MVRMRILLRIMLNKKMKKINEIWRRKRRRKNSY